MSDTVRLNRDDLREISNNPRVIRTLEKLIAAVPQNFVQNTSDANGAIARANAAQARSIKNERIAKGSRVLTWLSM